MEKVTSFFVHILGFEKLSRYETDYLHDANIRSCSYMGFIVVLLELWMLVRQTQTKILPKYQAGEDLFAQAGSKKRESMRSVSALTKSSMALTSRWFVKTSPCSTTRCRDFT